MPLPWALRGLRDGVVTTRWPKAEDPYFDTFPAGVGVSTESTTAERADLADHAVLDRICPTGALRAVDDDLAVDRGRCILCGRCVASAPRVFTFVEGSGTALLWRPGLLLAKDAARDVDEDDVEQVRRELAARVRRLRRSVHIRHVDAGSDGSDEWEVQALLNPVYDVHRLGVFFTASPRHADVLLVTGIGTAGMAEPLRRTRSAMPDPVVVIAAGADAISGGLVGRGYTGGKGVDTIIDVDVWVPGAPAPAFSLLYAILLAVDRLPSRVRSSGRTSGAGQAVSP